MIGQTISHYKIIEKLGGGGMGVVYKAEDTKLKRLVAIKFLPRQIAASEEERERFKTEAQAAAALNHPNITTIYAIEEVDDEMFIVMEYIAGRELREIINIPLNPPSKGDLTHSPLEGGQGGVRSINSILNYATQIAEGLRAAHAKGITHRDIKSSNIMVTESGQVKIMDFGLAKIGGSVHLTKAGTTLGTAAYMSPEQARGEPVDHRTDIWSFGVVLYEMLTGQLPFRGEYEQAVIYSILNENPQPISAASGRAAVPTRVEQIINKALAKSRDDRYQHPDEILKDLRSLEKELEAGFSQTQPARLPSRKKNSFALYGGIAVLAVTMIVGGMYLWRWVNTSKIESAKHLQVVLRQATFSEGIEEYPAFSPDGTQLVYTAEADGYKHLFAKKLDTGEEIQLTKGVVDDIQPAWSPDGHTILFVRSHRPDGRLEPGDVFGEHDGGDIWMMAPKTGKAFKIIENAFNPSFSPNGERVAFDASWAGPRRIWVADNLGRNPQQVSFDCSEAVSQIIPRWSPDGSRVVFQNLEKTKFDIKIVEIASKEMQWVTNDIFQDLNPVWSHADNAIYFSSYRSGGLNIWRVPMAASGKPSSNPQQMTTGAGQDVQLAISKDGKRLAFSILKLNADLWRLPVSDETGKPAGEPQPIMTTTREDSRGAWSPDSRMIAFNSDRNGDMNIWVFTFDGGAVRQITKGPGGDYQPNWSPDGKQLAFFSSRSGNVEIWVVEVATGELRQLTRNSALDFNPFFSPDGKYIAYQSDQYGRLEVWVMNADGTAPRQLSHVGVGGHFLRWSQDERFIIFSTLLEGRRQTLQVALDGSDPQPLVDVVGGSHISFSPQYTKIMDVVGHKTLWVTPLKLENPYKTFEFEDSDIRIDYPVWSPDGKWILFDRLKPQGGDIWLMENFE